MFSRLSAVGVVLAGIGLSVYGNTREGSTSAATMEQIVVKPAGLARIGSVDRRFQSYNVEMVEVTGGKFWKPYGPELNGILKRDNKPAPAPTSTGDTPAGMDPRLYEYRPPIDLGN